MDAFGHVNNVVYLRYLEEARVDMLFTHPAAHGGEGLADGVVVIRHEIDYLRPITFRPDPVVVETWVTDVRAASFALAYEVRDGRDVCAAAASVLVPYDLAGKRPRRLRPAERAVLAQYGPA